MYYNVRDLLGHFIKPASREEAPCPHACCKGKRPHPRKLPVMLSAAELRKMSDEALYEHYNRPETGKSGRAVRAALAEMERREEAKAAASRRAGARAGKADEYRSYLEHQWTAAEEATRGNMVNARGRVRSVDPRAFWTDKKLRDRYASDELRAYLDRHPVVSSREFGSDRAQAAGARRRRGARLYGVY